MLTCIDCGKTTSLLFVSMWDYCPYCKDEPFHAVEEAHA